jgi:uncharacterized integral membrane protein
MTATIVAATNAPNTAKTSATPAWRLGFPLVPGVFIVFIVGIIFMVQAFLRATTTWVA